MKDEKGFTLIELMMVIAIIGILASIALPNFDSYRQRAYMAEGFVLAKSVKEDLMEFYDIRGVFPSDNREAGLPAPEALIGSYVQSITVENGIIKTQVNAKEKRMLLTLTPKINPDYPTGPVAWTSDIKELFDHTN